MVLVAIVAADLGPVTRGDAEGGGLRGDGEREVGGLGAASAVAASAGIVVAPLAAAVSRKVRLSIVQCLDSIKVR